MTAMPSICAAAQDFYIVSVKSLIQPPPPSLRSSTATSTGAKRGRDLAPKQDLILAFGLVLAMAVIVLSITTWADHFPSPESNSVVPILPRQTIYRAQNY